jgi:hypothetical protein
MNDIDPEVCLVVGGIASLDPGVACDPYSVSGCCLPDNTCANLTEACCAAMDGVTQAGGAFCASSQACCLADATCEDLAPGCCTLQGGTPRGPGTTCTPSGNYQACALPSFECSVGDPVCCDLIGGEPEGAGSVCESQGCCIAHTSGLCLNGVDVQSCLMNGGIISLAPGQTCDPGLAKGCCLPNNTCVNVTTKCCQALGGIQQVSGLCASSTCTYGTQACCLPGGTCAMLTLSACQAQSGTPQGAGTWCGPKRCKLIQQLQPDY